MIIIKLLLGFTQPTYYANKNIIIGLVKPTYKLRKKTGKITKKSLKMANF